MNQNPWQVKLIFIVLAKGMNHLYSGMSNRFNKNNYSWPQQPDPSVPKTGPNWKKLSWPALSFVDSEALLVVSPVCFRNVECLLDVLALEVRGRVAVGSGMAGRGVARLRIAPVVMATIAAFIVVGFNLAVASVLLVGSSVASPVVMNRRPVATSVVVNWRSVTTWKMLTRSLDL